MDQEEVPGADVPIPADDHDTDLDSKDVPAPSSRFEYDYFEYTNEDGSEDIGVFRVMSGIESVLELDDPIVVEFRRRLDLDMGGYFDFHAVLADAISEVKGSLPR